MKKYSHQSGIAIITALLVLVLATTAVAYLTSRHQMDIRRMGNIINNDQAYWYALGAEAWATTILTEEFKNNRGLVVPTEEWEIVVPLEDVNGAIFGKITDLQARFNINNLLAPPSSTPPPNSPPPNSPPPNAKPSSAQAPGASAPNSFADQFLKLILSANQLEPQIADLVIDWIDTDINARGSFGAEDNFYVGLPIPYRSANHTILSISELRLLKDMTPETFAKLAPYLVALPKLTPVNINSADLLMLQAIGLDSGAAEAIISYREATPFNSVQEFFDFQLVKSSPSHGAILQLANMLTHQSNYYLLETRVQIDRGFTTLNSVLFQDSGTGNIHVIYRTLGAL